MNLLPKPQIMSIGEKALGSKTLCIKNLSGDGRIDKALRFFEQGAEGAELIIECCDKASEGYTLDICEDKITIHGDSVQGAFYGIQTLRQIFENDTVPCLHIEDKPDMGIRGFYHDVTRGKVPTVETLKNLIDTVAYYKMNMLQLYVEHTFPFKEFGDDIEKFGYLTADEIKELDDYCYDNFVEFVPSIATFGHLYELLQKEEYADLRVLDDYSDKDIFWQARMKHHTIDPLSPKSIEVIKSLIDQFMPLFRTDKFNICCDETFDLKTGKHKDKDTGRIYIDFVNKIIDYLVSKGKKIMMWGDIVLEHPETIQSLPADIQFLNWDYSPEPPEEKLVVFEKLGCRQIVCPGTSSWARLIEGIDEGGRNISNLLDLGYKHGAEGMLNTNWGDLGNPCSLELAMHGLVLGAAKSWNKTTVINEEFECSINALQYKNEKAVEYLTMLDEANKKISWKQLVKNYSNLCYGSDFEYQYPEEEAVKSAVGTCLKVIDGVKSQTWEKEEYRREMLIAAEGIIVMAELLAKLAGYKIERVSDTFSWLKALRESWLISNKESELREIEKMFNYVEQL